MIFRHVPISPKDFAGTLNVVGLLKPSTLASRHAALKARLRSCQRVRDFVSAIYAGCSRTACIEFRLDEWMLAPADDRLQCFEGCDLVIAEEFSRVSRSRQKNFDLLSQLAVAGIRFIAMNDGIDTADSVDSPAE